MGMARRINWDGDLDMVWCQSKGIQDLESNLRLYHTEHESYAGGLARLLPPFQSWVLSWDVDQVHKLARSHCLA